MNPPSFYENDIEKWKSKFQTSIKERAYFKSRYATMNDLKPYKVNTNV